jgi:hypothetical protein
VNLKMFTGVRQVELLAPSCQLNTTTEVLEIKTPEPGSSSCFCKSPSEPSPAKSSARGDESSDENGDGSNTAVSKLKWFAKDV